MQKKQIGRSYKKMYFNNPMWDAKRIWKTMMKLAVKCGAFDILKETTLTFSSGDHLLIQNRTTLFKLEISAFDG